jgi:four helix bundle protein
MNFIKIDERTFQFSLLIIEVYKYLNANKEYVLSKQLLRSGTSIGANVEEAQAGQSKADFISKMSIASKEARESKYWIRLLIQSNYLNEFNKKDELMDEIENIVNILTKIIKTSKEKKEGN